MSYTRYSRPFLLLLFVLGVLAFTWLPSRQEVAPQTSHWMDRVLTREFARFEKEEISQELLETTWKKCRTIKEFRRYQIIQSKVYGEEGRIKHLLEAVVRRYAVPDVDFIYYYEDRLKKSFFKRRQFREALAPIFVSAKHRSLDRVILFSDWLYDPTDPHNGWNKLIEVVNENQNRWSWEEKIDRLIWRGSPFDGKHFGNYTFENWRDHPRGRLVSESKRYPESIDAAFSQLPFHCLKLDAARTEMEMGRPSFISPTDQLQYKYQLLIDGVTCTFPGTHWKLLSGSVPFKQETADILYFFDELIPWKHYIPVRADMSDLLKKIEWARANDEKAKEIAQRAREFALTHLMPEHILEYCYKALVKYASLQTFQPTLEQAIAD